MNRRRVLSVITAVTLALVGMIIILGYVRGAERRAQEDVELVRALVATQEIEPGTSAADLDGAVRTEEIPAGLAEQSGGISNLAELEGQVTTMQIVPGQQLIEPQFGDPGEAAAEGTGEQVEEGREALAVVLPAERAVGGRIAAGDRVGVILSVDAADPESTEGDGADGGDPRTGMALNSIEVIRVAGAASSGEDEAGGDASANEPVTVWLEVTAADAERIVFTQINGTVWLTDQGEGIEGLPDDTTRDKDNIFRDISTGAGGDG